MHRFPVLLETVWVLCLEITLVTLFILILGILMHILLVPLETALVACPEAASVTLLILHSFWGAG